MRWPVDRTISSPQRQAAMSSSSWGRLVFPEMGLPAVMLFVKWVWPTWNSRENSTYLSGTGLLPPRDFGGVCPAGEVGGTAGTVGVESSAMGFLLLCAA